jgi:hypothetical protein
MKRKEGGKDIWLGNIVEAAVRLCRYEGPDIVVHVYNSSYSGGRDWKNHSDPAWLRSIGWKVEV